MDKTLKIKVVNLPVLKKAEFELGDMTIVCGDNNSGKTSLTNVVFSFLNERPPTATHGGMLSHPPFLVGSNRATVLEQSPVLIPQFSVWFDDSDDEFTLSLKVYPDKDRYVVDTNSEDRLSNTFEQKSNLVTSNPEIMSKFVEMSGGDCVVEDDGALSFVPSGGKSSFVYGDRSGAVHSLMRLGFYLKYQAQTGDLLMIDNPEMGLHPNNQRRMARLLARLVNLGVKVYITTHSDYIIKELNTLIMLNDDQPYLKRIAEVEGYDDSEMLTAEQIHVYTAENGVLTQNNVDSELGIEVNTFDDVINTMNRIQETIVWGGDDE